MRGFLPIFLELPSLSLALGGGEANWKELGWDGGWLCFQSWGPRVWQWTRHVELAGSGLPE